jgi:hypothetical protein
VKNEKGKLEEKSPGRRFNEKKMVVAKIPGNYL